jgi:hypothetical protein
MNRRSHNSGYPAGVWKTVKYVTDPGGETCYRL